MANTIPESAAIKTNELIGFIIYIIFFTPLMLVHPRRYHKYLWYAFGASVATMGGLFVWAIAANGGASVQGPSKVLSRAYGLLELQIVLLNMANEDSAHVASACCKQ